MNQKRTVKRVGGSSRKSNDLIRLAEKYSTDKWGAHWYAQHYHHHFSPYRYREIKLLEIGVGGYRNPLAGGESLRMWQEYFPKATIYGIDIYHKRIHEQGRIKVRQGSQDDEAFLRAVCQEAGGFDIIIDDGSHQNIHVIKAFLVLFPLLNDNGIYAVEDVQTSYWPQFGGSSDDLSSKRTTVGFFKALIDSLNYEEFLKPGYEPSNFDKHIIAMHFYHNLILVKKGVNNEGSNLLKNNIAVGGRSEISSASTMASAEDKRNARRTAGLSRTVRAGLAHHQAGRLDQAEALYRKALEKDPDHADALHLLGVIAYQSGQIGPAIQLIERALPALIELPDAHLNHGNALQRAGRVAEAVESYRRAIALKPDYGMAHSNLASALNDQGLFEAGLESARRAVELIPGFLGACVNCAAALIGLERFAEAEVPLRRALELMPDRAETHHDLGRVLAELRRFDEAVASYRRVVALKPDCAEAHCHLGELLKAQGKLREAIACFDRAVVLEPENSVALAGWFHERQNICDWSGYRESEARVRIAVAVRVQPSPGVPFRLLTLSSTPEEQLACARHIAAKIAASKAAVLPRLQPRPGERIRLGYLSADFREHPVALLLAGLIERHDRQSFEVLGYSCGPDDRSATRACLAGAFDRFVDIGMMPRRQAAELIHADGVHILIDLTGYTQLSRTAILAHRPAPIQVNFLGYPGTMGADFIDYIIVDRFVVPDDQQPFYTERLVHLPHCYQPSDTGREIANPAPSRAECGLPEEGFVFCCFNTSYKITPAFFDIWMRLLNAVPGSVLWLVARNAIVVDNLRREATRRGVAADRLVFTLPAPMPLYLGRLALADLFLDTLPYNAGATANDALWAGLPVLTCAGKTYAGRMAGALLKAVGLTELITTSLEEYAALALRLAQKPEMLAQLRARLAQNRATHPLFDTECFTRNLEAAYGRMWETWNAGQAPAAFSVSPSFNSSLGQPSRDI